MKVLGLLLLGVVVTGAGLYFYTQTGATTSDQINATSGTITPLKDKRYLVETPMLRADFENSSGNRARLSFIYFGPSRRTEPLESGELRRQIGLKLRAQDTCNTLYIMWRIEPEEGIYISAKRNPDQTSFEECGASGYTEVASGIHASSVVPLKRREEYTLSAELVENFLAVYANGGLAWRGEIPPELIPESGPSGIRTDNGIFEFVPTWEKENE